MIDLIKLQQILSSMGQSTGPTFPGNQNPMPMDEVPRPNEMADDDLESKLTAMFQPNEEQFNQLTALKPPSRADYNPSLMRKIAAMGAGLGGNRPSGMWGGQPVGFENDPGRDFAVRNAVLNEPYDKAISDYEMKLKPLQVSSELENRRNTNERMIHSQELKDISDRRRQDEAERKNRAAEEDRDLERKRKEKRDAAYIRAKQYAEDNPDYEKFIDATGQLVLYNPKKPLEAPIKTGVDSVTPLEVAELKAKDAASLEAAKQAGRVALEGQRQTGRESLEGTKQEGRLSLEGAKDTNRDAAAQQRLENSLTLKAAPGSATGRTGAVLPAQFSKAQEAYNTHQEWHKYLSLDEKSKTFEVKMPWFGGNKSTFDEVNKFIYGTTQPVQVAAKPAKLTDPDSGKTYPTTGWSDKDFEEARKRKWY